MPHREATPAICGVDLWRREAINAVSFTGDGTVPLLHLYFFFHLVKELCIGHVHFLLNTPALAGPLPAAAVLFVSFPGRRHCAPRVLKESRSRLMFETVVLFALAPQSCLLFCFSIIDCCCVKLREREKESPVAQQFSVLLWTLSVLTKPLCLQKT